MNSYPTAYLDEDGYDYSGRQTIVEHPCLAIKKLLSGGTFYYSTDFDLTNRLQNRWELSFQVNGIAKRRRL